MLQHITHDEGQIVDGDSLFLITQFGDTLRDATGLFGGEFQSEFFKIFGNIRLTAVLTQGILTTTSEALWHQFVLVEAVLLVAIGMDTSHLGEHIITNDGLIGGDGDTTITLHEARDIVEFVLMDVGLGMELILEDHLHTRQRGITTALPQPIDSDMQTLGTTENGCQ